MLKFKRVGNEIRVYAGRARVGTILPDKKYIRANELHAEAIRAYLLGFIQGKNA